MHNVYKNQMPHPLMMPAFPKPTPFCMHENSDPPSVLVDQSQIVYNTPF